MLSKKKISIIFIIAVLLSGGLGFYGGWHSQTPQKASVTVSSQPDTKNDFSPFWQTWNAIHNNFVDAKALDNQALIYGAANGLVESLGDPYSVFFTPKEAKTFEEDLSGSFEGVGMEVGIKDKTLTVISPLTGTPADKAGLLPGDKITSIDEKSTQNLSLEKCVQLIRGKKGTQVTLTISRPDSFQDKKFTLIRERIEVPSVEWKFKKPDIAYVQIHQFYGNSNKEFNQTAIQILSNPKVKRIVLDLRNNPGGYLNVVQDIAGWFLKPGETVAIEQFNPSKEDVFVAKGNSKLANYPVIVLINQGSASGAEILAGALRDNRNVKLVGEKSFGKGSVQEPINLNDQSMIKLTIAKWLTPHKACINKKGLIPDIKITMTKDDYKNKLDPQLDKAIKIVEQLTK